MRTFDVDSGLHRNDGRFCKDIQGEPPGSRHVDAEQHTQRWAVVPSMANIQQSKNVRGSIEDQPIRQAETLSLLSIGFNELLASDIDLLAPQASLSGVLPRGYTHNLIRRQIHNRETPPVRLSASRP